MWSVFFQACKVWEVGVDRLGASSWVDLIQFGKVPGLKPPSHMRSYSVMVITLDSESSDPGSSPGRTLLFSQTLFLQVTTVWVCRVRDSYKNRYYSSSVKTFEARDVKHYRPTHLLATTQDVEKKLYGDIPLFQWVQPQRPEVLQYGGHVGLWKSQ